MTCPACHETPGDPARDMDDNYWCTVHAARALADVATLLRLPTEQRQWVGLVVQDNGALWLGQCLEHGGIVVRPPGPSAADMERLSYE